MATEDALAPRRRSPGRRRWTAGRDRRPLSSAIAPASMPITLSAMSSCTNSTRAAEQRWPAEPNAEPSASLTTCSGSAEESAIIAFWPPVSAIRVAIAASRAGQRAVDRARGVGGAGEATPATRGSRVSAAPTVAPSPGRYCSTLPARRLRAAASPRRSRSRLVCSAGLAITLLPAASAAATWPMKIASGKFHGLMQTNTPRPCRCSSFDSPVGPGSAIGCELLARLLGVVAQEVDRLAHLGDAVGQRLAGFLGAQRHELRHARFQQVAGVFQDRGARPAGVRSQPVARPPRSAAPFPPWRIVRRLPVADALAAIGRIGDGALRAGRVAPGTSGVAVQRLDGRR
jgi:hypothetical protein